jgi:hypothetical protein
MPSDSYPNRPNFKRNHPDRDRYDHSDPRATYHLADQQLEAAMRELNERFRSAESAPRDRTAAGNAIRAAWNVLSRLGFRDFDQIKDVRTEEWPSLFDQKLRPLVSLALEIVGWYQFGLRPYDIDRTARIFDRALELTPQNQRALERFATVANTILPEHLTGLARFPKKQQETALGYKLQCKTKIDNILQDVFGITESYLVGQADQPLSAILSKCGDRERRFIFEILGHLAKINAEVGLFFGNGTQLSLGIGAACCQLEMLGLPRDIGNTITILRSRLSEGDATEIAGEETPLVIEILETIATLCDGKWRLFKNQSSQRRAQEIRDLLADIA